MRRSRHRNPCQSMRWAWRRSPVGRTFTGAPEGDSDASVGSPRIPNRLQANRSAKKTCDNLDKPASVRELRQHRCSIKMSARAPPVKNTNGMPRSDRRLQPADQSSPRPGSMSTTAAGQTRRIKHLHGFDAASSGYNADTGSAEGSVNLQRRSRARPLRSGWIGRKEHGHGRPSQITPA